MNALVVGNTALYGHECIALQTNTLFRDAVMKHRLLRLIIVLTPEEGA